MSFFLSLLSSIVLTAATPAEDLCMRRIHSSWQAGEFETAKSQIEALLEEYPQSPYADECTLLLGDYALKNGKPKLALQLYESVSLSPEKMRVRRWQALYELKLFSQLYEETSSMLSQELSLDAVASFYCAESCLRQANDCLGYEEGKIKAQHLLKQALPLYSSLAKDNNFKNPSYLGLAEIHRLQGDLESAIPFYLQLGQSVLANPSDEALDLLFYAASVLKEKDQENCGMLLSILLSSSPKHRQDAASMLFDLLVEAKSWETMAEKQEMLLGLLPPEKAALCDYYLGHHAFIENKFSNALFYLQKSLENNLPKAFETNALLLAIQSSYCLQDLESMEEHLNALKKICKDKTLIDQVTLWLSDAESKSLGTSTALERINELIKDSDSPYCATLALIKKVEWLQQQQKYKEAHTIAMRAAASAEGPLQKKLRLQTIETAASLAYEEQTDESFNRLASALESLLETTQVSQPEKARLSLMLANTYLALKKEASAITLLEALAADSSENAKAHYLLAKTYAKSGSHPEKVIKHGQKALASAGSLPFSDLHLALFNAYIQLARQDLDNDYTKIAASHLYEASICGPLSLENRLWLAYTFAKEAKRSSKSADSERAISLLLPLLEDKSQWRALENEIQLLLSLYELSHQTEKGRELLQQLTALQNSEPNLGWTTQDIAALKLAHLYKQDGNIQEALHLYAKCCQSGDDGIALEAKLEQNRLLLQTLPEEERLLKGQSLRAILKNMQEMAECKTIQTEPFHLESAIDRADFIAELLPKHCKDKDQLALLQNIKEEFTSREKAVDKAYHEMRPLYPEKDRLYQAYMRYLEARIFSLQAKIAKAEGKQHDAETKEKAARALFTTLRTGKLTVTAYLEKRLGQESYKR